MPSESVNVVLVDQLGQVRWMDGKKGYGMISIVGMESPSEDVFFHYSEIQELDGFQYLPPETLVRFDLAEEAKSAWSKNNGYSAKKVRMIPARPEDHQS